MKNMRIELSIYKVGLLFILLGGVVGCQSPPNEEYLRHVGDIAFDPELDDPNFEVCNEKSTQQYYAFSNGFQYKGEKTKIREEVHAAYTAPNDATQNGYITIRFMVNCKGQTGRFRVETMDRDFQPFQFKDESAAKLLKIVQSLKDWNIAYYEGKPFDYYQYFTFKINSGQIEAILP